MSRLFPLTTTPGIADAALRWLAGERWEEAAPRRASTVMLVRDGDAGTEVFLLRRVSQMAFAPSTMVFPGGGVDPRDADPELPWSGPSPTEWAARLGCATPEAQTYVAAAVREVFEECGVLLASTTPDGPLADVSDPSWRGVRERLVDRDLSLAEVLLEHGLYLRSDLIVAKAHWLTPVFEPRRFDTWFFAALMPGHQVADGATSEADHAAWFAPTALLEAYAAGSASMLPPTVICVEAVRDAPSAAEFVAHSADLPLVMPEVVDTPDGPAMRIVEYGPSGEEVIP
ncbi:NUDIX hydrolase [Intrasporangium oryzae NRRL B-24470]|uniref:NUDIX hydrolase n=1 Tax=Intrasporangium oryzae NRRL B-24470 TaxID=1386089 RepID=W9G5W5_9MICO|nr:NUDIX domain-containing protein [Intrasporangium oryzae]EWT00188.1 NUDIX hydrolase [Intrasporangium oryzae NRRL B-24470]